jgi:hypothetical protein
MRRRRLLTSLILLGLFLLTMIANISLLIAQSDSEEERLVDVRFSFDIDRNMYGSTVYRSPPQWAVWIESPDSEIVRTLWVTRCTAQSTWRGKTSCPTALPHWTRRYNETTGTEGPPTLDNPLPDAVSRPTPVVEPKGTTFAPDSPDRWDYFRESIALPSGSEWNYFIEVNISGDYNETYLQETPEGVKDEPGNGQPAIVYQGSFTVGDDPESTDPPEIVGRADQYNAEIVFEPAEDEITTAREILANIGVSWDPQKKD